MQSCSRLGKFVATDSIKTERLEILFLLTQRIFNLGRGGNTV